MTNCLEIENISLYGSEKDKDFAKEIISSLDIPDIKNNMDNLNIAKAYLILGEAIEYHNIKADILLCGNTVYNKSKLLKNLRTMKKLGMEKMSDYTYKFLTLECGSIAHYDKGGWISQYPTISHFKQFLKNNEFGKSVLNYIPWWNKHSYNIVKEINDLFNVKIEKTRADEMSWI